MLEFRKAFELDENNIQAGVNLGNYYIRNLDFGKASIAMKGLSSNPVKDWRVMNSYASVLASQKKYSQAKDIYKDILRSQSNQREVLFNYLVLLVDGLKDQDESSAVLQKLKFLGYPDGSQGKMIQLENKIKTGLK
jgi:Tfp pilus assembly protein PilF